MKPRNAQEQLGVSIKVNTELDKLSEKVLFPEKVERINKLVKQISVSKK